MKIKCSNCPAEIKVKDLKDGLKNPLCKKCAEELIKNMRRK